MLLVCLVQAQYLIVLCTFKEQLQQHVRVHAVEAVMACRDIENTLQALTGMYTATIYLPLRTTLKTSYDLFIKIFLAYFHNLLYKF